MTRTGKGLDAGVLKAGSLVIDTRVKVGAVLWLQEKYDKEIGDIMKLLGKGNLADIANLIIALALQHNPDLPEVEVTKAVKQLELNDLTKIATGLTSAFEADAKNSKRPVAGNLQE